MNFNQTQPSSYRVEVSGWDGMENFFVEIVALCWNEDTNHTLATKARLCNGDVIFVRLLQPLSSDENFPVPYVVSKLRSIEMDGRSNLLVTRLHPRPAFKQAAEARRSAVQVA